ncbi:transposase [Patescibacteria group bacterium]|nr:transposase [Patescibacteria group bacterium]
MLVYIISDTFSFPFLDEIAAATIIDIIKNIERWPDKKKFKKALGVYSSLTQSGGSSGRTKQGKIKELLENLPSYSEDIDYEEKYEKAFKEIMADEKSTLLSSTYAACFCTLPSQKRGDFVF